MTNDTKDASVRAASAAARIRDLQAVFDGIRDLLRAQTLGVSQGNDLSPKAMLAKLSELQSAQVTLLKAEEAFHEKYDDSEDADILDHDEIRAELGRRLDRIRAARDAGAVPV